MLSRRRPRRSQSRHIREMYRCSRNLTVNMYRIPLAESSSPRGLPCSCGETLSPSRRPRQSRGMRRRGPYRPPVGPSWPSTSPSRRAGHRWRRQPNRDCCGTRCERPAALKNAVLAAATWGMEPSIVRCRISAKTANVLTVLRSFNDIGVQRCLIAPTHIISS